MKKSTIKKVVETKDKNVIDDLKPKPIKGTKSYVCYTGVAEGNKQISKVKDKDIKKLKNIEFCILSDMGDQIAIGTKKQTISIYKDHLRILLGE